MISNYLKYLKLQTLLLSLGFGQGETAPNGSFSIKICRTLVLWNL